MNMNEFLFKVERRVRLFSFDANLAINRTLLSGSDNAVNYFQVKFTNFGDMLIPLFLKYYGLVALPTLPEDADLFCAGSILDKVSPDFTGTILGSGLLRDERRNFSKANVMAVRGSLTRERIDAPDSTVLGDPGILVDRLLSRRKQKRYKIGLVPHYEDKDDVRLIEIHRRFPKQTTIIDVKNEPIAVIKKIDQCEFILSSSLHGVITADSLGIPNAWIFLSDKVIGGGFKFYDYATSFGTQIEPRLIKGTESIDDLVKLTHEVHKNVEVVKNNLEVVFLQFREQFLSSKR